jgi:hypothetical protein
MEAGRRIIGRRQKGAVASSERLAASARSRIKRPSDEPPAANQKIEFVNGLIEKADS